jgi:dTDP-4-dehydrorhamnose 3,5-epimerase
MITFKRLSIPDVVLIQPQVFKDDRGFFFESFNQNEFEKAINRNVTFVQDNHSKSSKGVLRGMHYQLDPYAQGKLVRVISGEVFDVAVDIRKGSNTYGQWVGEYLSAKNKKQLWIPEGFAHGFVVTSNEAEFLYKTTNFYNRDSERVILWSDPDIGIKWPMSNEAIMISPKDQQGSLLSSVKDELNF